MTFGSFTLTARGNQLPYGVPASGTLRVEVISPGTQQIIADTASNTVFIGPKTLKLGPLGTVTVALPSDVSTGQSATIGYRLTMAGDGELSDTAPVDIWARAIGSSIDLADLVTQVVEPIGDTSANKIAAQAAQAAAETAAAAAVAVGSTNDTIIASRVNDAATPSATRAALDTLYAPVSTVTAAVDDTTLRFDQFPVELPTGLVINTTVIAQQVTTSPAGDTYAVFYGVDRNAYVAKMRYGRYAWSVTNLGAIPGLPLGVMPDDSHNYLTIVVDGDGYIHVAGNAHARTMQYVRSANPDDISAWVTGVIPNPESMGQTYPKFIVLGTGDLLLFNRQGGGPTDGAGRMEVVNKYTKSTKTWARVTTILDGTPPVSPAEGPYVSRVSRNVTTGRLHLFYMWRQGYLTAATNHDLAYIYSDDDGVTWRTVDSTIQTLPIHPANTAPCFVTGYIGAINQSGATVDSNGRPHSIWRIVDEVRHYYHNGTAWVMQSIDPGPASTPAIYATNDGRVYALYTDGSNLKARKVYPTLDTSFIVVPGWSLPYYNPSFDPASEQSNVLRLTIAPGAAITGGAYGGVLTVDMSTTGVGKVIARTAYPRMRPIAPPPTRKAIIPNGRNVYPMRDSLWYAPGGGARQNTSLIPNGQFRGYPFTVSRSCAVTNAAFSVTTAGSSGTVAQVVIYGLSDGLVRGFSSTVAVTSIGEFEVALDDLWLSAGETAVAGLWVGSASGAGPAFLAISGDSHDPLVGCGTGAAILSAPRSGWAVDGVAAPPVVFATGWYVAATPVGNPPVVALQAGNVITSGTE